MTPCKLPARKCNTFHLVQGRGRVRSRPFPFYFMEETAIVTAIQELIKSGALKNLDQPGAQTLLIYALLVLLAIFAFRVIVINGWLKKGVDRFFALEEQKIKHLADLNEKVVTVQRLIDEEHGRLSDVMRLLHAQRESDVR